MKILKFQSKEAWLQARVGKITGSRLGDVTLKRGGGYKKGFYELIAERVAIPDVDGVPANPMDRGTYLEPFALERFAKETGKKVDGSLVMWVRDNNENIAVSPDGTIGKTEVVECKCLNSASHIEAWLSKKIPEEYEFQYLQYFITNDKLKLLHFCFYDPRVPAKDFFYFTINRKDLKDKVKEYLEFEIETLKEVEKITNALTF